MNAATRRILIQFALLGAFFIGSIGASFTVVTIDSLNAWVYVSAITAVATTLTFDAAWSLWKRTTGGRTLSTRGTVAFSAGIGTAYAIARMLSIQAFGLTPENDALVSFTSSVLTISLIGAALSALITGRRLEEERRRRLLDEGIAVATARQDVIEIAQRMHMTLETDIDTVLAPARRSIEECLADQERLLSQDDWFTAAQQLRSAAQDTVKPLSRELWSRTAARLAPVTARSVLGNIMTRQPFRPLMLTFILLLTGFSAAVDFYGWVWGIGVMGLGVLLIFVILGTANMAMRRWPQHHAALFITGSLVLQLGTLLNFPFRTLGGAPAYTWAEAMTAMFIGILLILLTSGAGSLRAHRDDVVRTFQADIDRELMESIAASRQVARLARESARILHGTVQTRLIACAVAIEQAALTQDVAAFQHALHEAHEVLAQPTRSEHADATTLQEEVARKAQLWSGLCAIDVSIDPGLATIAGRLARDVGRVVEEGMSNAITHGEATALTVSVNASPDGIHVDVTDNGRGLSGGSPGLGSALLDVVASSWDLESLPDGTRLRALIPR